MSLSRLLSQQGLRGSGYMNQLLQQQRCIQDSMLYSGFDLAKERNRAFEWKKKPQTIREELQESVSEWIKDVL